MKRMPGAPRPLVVALFTALTLTGAQAQTLLTGPAWEIAVSDYGYSDYLGDLTPGFQGREYLSGEWGAAVGYAGNGSVRSPTWLEPNFIYPDWTTNSDFTVESAMTLGAKNTFGLPTASSVISNQALRITQHLQIVDTRTGIAMGNAAASLGGAGASLLSNRYVLLQSYTFENISGGQLDNLQFFQFLHGLNAQSGVVDNRAYSGAAMADYRYDVTQGGDAGGGAGQFDYIGFHSKIAPSAVEVGYYGNEQVDSHSVGKPSVGTHLSVEANDLNGTDSFSPTVRWVAGAQRFDLGTLTNGQSTTFDVVLSIRTGYQVAGGGGDGGGIGGGAGNSGGVDYLFEGSHGPGQFTIGFEREDASSLAALIAAGQIGTLTFGQPGTRLPLWEIEYSASFQGQLTLTFGFDPTLLPTGLDLSRLHIYHWTHGAWSDLGGSFQIIGGMGSVTVATDSLSPFALGVTAVPEPATWALWLGGLLVAGQRLRRRGLASA
jgi:hypothetical protein